MNELETPKFSLHDNDPDDLPNKTSNFFLLRELVEYFGKQANFFIHLISRYKIIRPQRTAKYGERPIFEFSTDEVLRVGRAIRLSDLGYKLSEVAEHMNNPKTYDELVSLFKQYFTEYLKSGSSLSWQQCLLVISAAPDFTEPERIVWSKLLQGFSWEETRTAAGLSSRKDTKDFYLKAQRKSGIIMTRFLHDMASIN